MKKLDTSRIFLSAVLALSLAGCTSAAALSSESTAASETIEETAPQTDPAHTNTSADTNSSDTENSTLSASDQFTDRDLAQTADLSSAVSYTLSDGQTITISEEGIYVLQGNADNVTVIVDALDTDKVQIVLDGVSVTNESAPVIYVKNADKVFVTTTSTENSLSVTGTFTADGETNTDAVIFSKDDLTINGTGTLKVTSTANGITSKDDLKVTGSTLSVTCADDALEANDSIRIAGGTITIDSEKDGLHAENDEDDTVGYIYISGGTLTIDAADDAVHATTILQVDDGTLDLEAREGLEATQVLINGGDITIAASDDGINSGRKSNAYTVLTEITGGNITITMGAGDTDAIDSNGNLVISGGTIDITANSPFDYDGAVSFTGGTLIINGQETTQISNQMMGGFGGQGQMPGGEQGQMPGGEQGQMPGGEQGQMPDGNQGGHGPGGRRW